MHFKSHRINVNYQIEFVQPLFQLPSMAVQVIEAFYKTLNPRFSLQMSDLQSRSGTTYADVALIFNLFSGAGLLEIRPDKFSATFQNLRSEADLKKVRDCVELSEDTIRDLFPSLEVSRCLIRLSLWLQCEGGADAVNRILDKHGSAGFPIAKEDFGAQDLEYTLRAELKNVDERWQTGFTLQRSAISEAELFYGIDATYEAVGKYNSLEQRVEHTREMSLGLLATLGLEPETGGTK